MGRSTVIGKSSRFDDREVETGLQGLALEARVGV